MGGKGGAFVLFGFVFLVGFFEGGKKGGQEFFFHFFLFSFTGSNRCSNDAKRCRGPDRTTWVEPLTVG